MARFIMQRALGGEGGRMVYERGGNLDPRHGKMVDIDLRRFALGSFRRHVPAQQTDFLRRDIFYDDVTVQRRKGRPIDGDVFDAQPYALGVGDLDGIGTQGVGKGAAKAVHGDRAARQRANQPAGQAKPRRRAKQQAQHGEDQPHRR